MNNITYLFGAGASYYACPILNELGDRMVELSSNIELKIKSKTVEKQIYSDEFLRITNLIKEYGLKSKEFNTIDTYAKKLYLLNKPELNDLKLAVSLFFTIWSLTDNEGWKKPLSEDEEVRGLSIDPRYISLLATYLERGKNYPILRNEVKFVTWNYDLQLEEAYRQFTDIEHQNYFAVNNYFPFFPSEENKSNIVCCHLNGFHGFYGTEKGNELFERVKSKNLEEIIESLSFIFELDSKKKVEFNKFINYAWEESVISIIARQRAAKVFSETNILVVIGYSFPPFNHEIDKLLLESAKRSLKKLIIQDPKVDADYIYETFGIAKGKIQVVRNTQQFVIPNYYETKVYHG